MARELDFVSILSLSRSFLAMGKESDGVEFAFYFLGIMLKNGIDDVNAFIKADFIGFLALFA